MPDDRSLSQLTRSLMLGASVGTLAFIQIGCTPPATQSSAQSNAIRVASEDEARLCRRALETRAAADVNALLRAHPQSSCIAPLLTALPGTTLAALSPDALSAVPSGVRGSLPARVQSQLPAEVRPSVAPRPAADRDIDDDGGY